MIQDNSNQKIINLESVESKNIENNVSKSVISEQTLKKKRLNPDFGYARSDYECELCTDYSHFSDMITMIKCTHKFCINFLRKYFTLSIREKAEIIICCPFCKEPKIDYENENALCDYLSLLDQ